MARNHYLQIFLQLFSGKITENPKKVKRQDFYAVKPLAARGRKERGPLTQPSFIMKNKKSGRITRSAQKRFPLCAENFSALRREFLRNAQRRIALCAASGSSLPAPASYGRNMLRFGRQLFALSEDALLMASGPRVPCGYPRLCKVGPLRGPQGRWCGII